MKYFENDNLILSSTGLFSSWCYYKKMKTLFDCGDGISLALNNRIMGINRIFIGHSHIDHISGLLAFIGLRNVLKGGCDQRLDIWCNLTDPFITQYIELINKFYPPEKLSFVLYWNDISAGQKVEIYKNVYVKAFKVEHTEHSLGFCICLTSKGLKDGIDPKTVYELIKSGQLSRDEIYTEREIREFAYLLDSANFDVNEIKGVKEVVFDCTFLNEKDRDYKSHSSLVECESFIKDSRCVKAYLSHVSPRYKITRGKYLIWEKSKGLQLDGNSTTFGALAAEIPESEKIDEG